MKIEYEDCLRYKNKTISVGVQHEVSPDKLFYFYGKLIDVTADAIKLQMTNGIRIIPLSQILELKTRVES